MSITLTEIIDSLVTRLAAELPGVNVTPDPPTGRSLRLPALVVELTEIDPVGNQGDTRTLIEARFELRVIVDPAGPRPHLAVRELAARALHVAYNLRRIAPGHGHIRMLRAGEDGFRPELDGYQVWVVEFAAEIALGELEPEGPPPPTEVWIGYDPDIGTGHEADYTLLEHGA